MSQDGRQRAKQKYRRERRAVAEEPSSPCPDHSGGEHEERKDADPCERQVPQVGTGGAQNRIARAVRSGKSARPESGEIRKSCRRGVRQRRRLDARFGIPFPLIGGPAEVHPHHSAGEVMGLVAGLEENGIRERDAHERHGDRRREQDSERERRGDRQVELAFDAPPRRRILSHVDRFESMLDYALGFVELLAGGSSSGPAGVRVSVCVRVPRRDETSRNLAGSGSRPPERGRTHQYWRPFRRSRCRFVLVHYGGADGTRTRRLPA